MTPARYKAKTQMIVTEAIATRYVIAVNHDRHPIVWVQPLRWRDGLPKRWIVTGNQNASSYMFKDDGTFGSTETYADREANSFESLEEALAAFLRFCGSPVEK